MHIFETVEVEIKINGHLQRVGGLRTGRMLFIKWTTEGIVNRRSCVWTFPVFYDVYAYVSCEEYVSILMRVWIPQIKVAPR